MKRNFTFSLIVSFLFLTAGAFGATRHVPGAYPYITIQQAIDDANDGDIISVAPGTYTPPAPDGFDFKGKAIVVQSASNNPADCNINCNSNGRAFYFHTGETISSVVRGFTITNGSEYFGGAIECESDANGLSSSPTIENCILTGNTAGAGGAIDCYESSPLIKDCVITNNSAEDGGAIECGVLSAPTIQNCLIASNIAAYNGGAIDCYDGSSPKIKNCTIANNKGTNTGKGGIYAADTSHPTAINSILWNNGDDLFGNVTTTYSYIQDGDAGMGNINVIANPNPKFATGTLGSYYLSQTAAGQLADSPCVNAGNDANGIDVNSLTTRTDNAADANTIDMGYHYVADGNMPKFKLTAGVAVDANQGTLTINPVSPDSNYVKFSEVQFTATPNLNYSVKKWTVNGVDMADTNTVRTIVMDANYTVTVSFVSSLIYRLETLTLDSNGTIDPYPNPSDPINPDAEFIKGTSITIHAQPTSGYTVKRWIKGNKDTFNRTNPATYTVIFDINDPNTYGAVSDSNTAYTFSIDANTTVGVGFTPNTHTYTLTTTVIGGHGTLTPRRGPQPQGMLVALNATPAAGYRVRTWGGAATNQPAWDMNSNTVSMTAPKTVTVEFEIDTPTFVLTTTADPCASIDPCYPSGQNVLAGSVVTLHATIPMGTIVQWTGTADDNSMSLENTVRMTANRTVNVGFRIPKIYHVPGNYPYLSIQDALDQAIQGDIIQIAPGTYPGTGFIITQGITIVGNPEDPNLVVIDCEDQNAPGLEIRSVNPVVINGITIANVRLGGLTTGWYPKIPGLATDANPAYTRSGGGIIITGNSNHTITNCIVRDCTIIGGKGQNGKDGIPGDPKATVPIPPTHPGGDGGNGGNARGCGIFIGAGNPTISNTLVENCTAIGGDAGNGGKGLDDSLTDANYPGGPGGNGGCGGSALGAGIYCSAGTTPIFNNCIIRNCTSNAGKAGNGGNAAAHADATVTDPFGFTGYGQGGHGGVPGNAAGASVYIEDLGTATTTATFTSCQFTNGAAYSNSAGNGGDSSDANTAWWRGGVGGLTNLHTQGIVIARMGPILPGTWGECPPGNPLRPDPTDPTLTAPHPTNPYRPGNPPQSPAGIAIPAEQYSANGGDVFVDNGANVTFINCQCSNGVTRGSVSGIGGNNTNNQFSREAGIWGGTSALTNREYPSDYYRIASFGGGVYAGNSSTTKFTNCIVQGNTTTEDSDSNYVGEEYTGYGGGLCVEGTTAGGLTSATLNNCTISDNNCPIGGGIYAQDMTTFDMNDCSVTGNTAYFGGGLFAIGNTASNIEYCRFSGNTATNSSGTFGDGGGIFNFTSALTIWDSVITANNAVGAGAGLYFGGSDAVIADPTMRNCLITGNAATDAGAGVFCDMYAALTAANCTVADNKVSAENGLGGGLATDYGSGATITNSIIWGNEAAYGSQIGLDNAGSGYPVSTQVNISYSDIDIAGGTYAEAGSAITASNNISKDPKFDFDYYLKEDSNCIDAGGISAAAAMLANYTTQLSGVFDMGTVDLGYHHRILPIYQITVQILQDANYPNMTGTITADPNRLISYDANTSTYIYSYYEDMTPTFKAIPDNSIYYVLGWYNQSNKIVSSSASFATDVNANATYFVRLKPRKMIHVPGDYPYIQLQQAIDIAEDGDMIIIESGEYLCTGFEVYNKDIIISGANPDDANSTVINCAGQINGGFELIDTTGGGCELIGLTITNVKSYIADSLDGKDPGDQGGDGGWHAGQALRLAGNHKITNCIIRNASAQGGKGGDGKDGDSTVHNGGRGGDGGDASGAGIFIYFGDIVIKNTLIEDCKVTGGQGGNGANGNNDEENATNSGVGGRGGYGGKAFGGGICVYNYGKYYGEFAPANVIVQNCVIRNCKAIAGHGGDGGDSGYGAGTGAYGGLTYEDPAQTPPTDNTANGGAIYIDSDCNVAFIDCTITDSSTTGSISGIGGESWGHIKQHPLQHDYIPSFGGGIYAGSDSYASFSGCIIQNNTTDPNKDYYTSYGGGMAAEDSSFIELVNSNVTNNFATVGGGLYCGTIADMQLADCNIADNFSYLGGGLFVADSNIVDINDCNISGNSATYSNNTDPNASGGYYGSGGGIYCWTSDAWIFDCMIKDNIASGTGGGAYLGGNPETLYPLSATPEIKNCLITDNIAALGGGVAATWAAEAAIKNSTIANNTATGGESQGGGLFVAYGADVNVVDTIIWNNGGVSGSQVALSDGDSEMPASVTFRNSDVSLAYTSGINLSDSNSTSGTTLLTPKLVRAQAIYDEINASGTAKVIVTLDESGSEATNWSSPQDVSNLRTRVATLQTQVLSTLDSSEFSLRQKLTNSAVFSGQVNVSGLSKLMANAKVAHIEPVRKVYPQLAQGLPLMNALSTRTAYSGTGIAIAVVDTGVDYTHTKLGGGGFPNDKVIGGYDTGEDDADPMPVGNAHGTCCAGIIAGDLGTVSSYIGGVVPNAKIYALKASLDNANDFLNDAILAAWDWCITHKNDDTDNPILVISNSLGGNFYTNSADADEDHPSFVEAIKKANKAGITILAASGNDGFTNGISFPAALSNVISVGAVYDADIGYTGFAICTDSSTAADKVTCYSNTASILDILAPSHNAYTTDIVGEDGYSSGDYDTTFGGTSAACPYAAGAVAAMQDAAKRITGSYFTPAQVRDILVNSGRPITDTKVAITKPRINLSTAIAMISPTAAIYKGTNCTLEGFVQDINDKWMPEAGYNNLSEDPNFVLGYYLGRTITGQSANSPCIDAGSISAVAAHLENYTTSLNGVFDINQVDIGYHYSKGLPQYQLSIDANSTPDSSGTTKAPWTPGTYVDLFEGRVITVEALPGLNSRVAWWKLDGVKYTTHDRTFTVTMNKSHSLSVQFEYYSPKNIIVPDEYENIQDAINAAESGDTIYIFRRPDGGHHYISDPEGLDFKGKTLKIRSEDPNDPNIVAATIIDCADSGRAFIFRNNEDANCIVEGLTIINASTAGAIGSGYRTELVSNGSEDYPIYIIYHGVDAAGDGYGGAIYLDRNTAPTIRNCVFKDCKVTGGRGSDGGDGYGLNGYDRYGDWIGTDAYTRDGDNQRVGEGGDGGNGSGNGYGGAFYCGKNSAPTILNCQFIDCTAMGGLGGEGGNGSNATSDKIPGDGGDGGDASNGFGYGGSIYCAQGAYPKITRCDFKTGLATFGLAGQGGTQGAGKEVKSTDPPPYVHDGSDGSAYGGAGYGGVIYYEEGTTVDVNDCNMLNNTADSSTTSLKELGGGAIYCEENCTVVSIRNSSLSGNQTTAGYGGAVKCGVFNELKFESCYFGGNTAAENGGALSVGESNDANLCILDINSCAFTDNYAGGVGGAIFARNFDANFTDCYINRNTAASGGGLYLSPTPTRAVQIHGGTIMDNNAIGENGEGGGAYISNMPVEFVNCQITGNFSTFGAGGIMFKGPDSEGSTVHNCLFAENEAIVRGGAILTSLHASIDITSCTFDKNAAKSGGEGGALFNTHSSLINVKDCIFSNMTRTAVYENSTDCEVNLSYCLFYNNANGDFYNRQNSRRYKVSAPDDINAVGAELAALNAVTGGNNKYWIKPTIGIYDLYSKGPLGNHYLTQAADGINTGFTSPAVDSGSALAVNVANNAIAGMPTMAKYTTRIDSNSLTANAGDAGQLDIGFHYIDVDPARDWPKQYDLTTLVLGGHGGIEPATCRKYAGTTVEITALPDSGWRVNQWLGTDNDSSVDIKNYVVMISNRLVSVSYEQPLDLHVPSEYTALQYAINDAKSGDRIILAQGTYKYSDINYDFGGVTIIGKNITITSSAPDDPDVVAGTIILESPFNIQNVDRTMILEGFTIKNARYEGGDCTCTHCPTGPSGDGDNGGSILGGAMTLYNASPTIRNCRFENCAAFGGDGAPGCSEGGDGGWGGYAHGGAVGIGYNSNPIFKNCGFVDCEAIGGDGGDADSTKGHGGSWGDPNGAVWHTWDFGDGRGPNGGYADYWFYSGYGGAVYVSSGSGAEFEKCFFTGNTAFGGVCGLSNPPAYPWPQRHYAIDTFGGAVYIASGGSTKFTDCSFVRNQADTRNQISDADVTYESDASNAFELSDSVVSYGGAICAEGDSAPIIENCVFIENAACAGGALYIEDATAYISGGIEYDAEFDRNMAILGGGATFVDSNSIIFDCVFKGNTAQKPADSGFGGGIYSASSNIKFFDCKFNENSAQTSGGGAYFAGDGEPNMHNCLIIDNDASRDGGGISVNWDTQLGLSNCTIVNNTTSGGGFASGFGGGVSCDYEAYVKIINSIIWNNNAAYGKALSVGNQLEAADKYRAEAMVSYSSLQNGEAGVFVDTENGSLLHWTGGNLSGTTLKVSRFFTGYWGDYYLGQPTGQLDPNDLSPCVDAGEGQAIDHDLFRHTTRTDSNDPNIVPGWTIDDGNTDMGYHYMLYADLLGDFNFDGEVNLVDLDLFMAYWLEDGCVFPYFCHGRDLNKDGEVDFEDFNIFAGNNADTETTPPSPNPMTWYAVPHSTGIDEIAMIATTARDNSGSPILYNFIQYGPGGAEDFGWQSEPNLTATGLLTHKEYGYRVRAKDLRGNTTEWSVIGYAVPGEDTVAPSPSPMEWLIEPTAISTSEITMTAADITSVEPDGVEYYFTNITDTSHNSGWQTSAVYLDSGLEPNTVYLYQVKARDLSPNLNETLPSVVKWARTFTEGNEPVVDVNAPTYTPTSNGLWVMPPYTYYDGSVYYYHYMTAVGATDEQSPPVVYYFDCTSGNGIDSEPIIGTGDEVTYIAGPFTSYNHSTYRVIIRDSATPTPNQLISTKWNTLYGLMP